MEAPEEQCLSLLRAVPYTTSFWLLHLTDTSLSPAIPDHGLIAQEPFEDTLKPYPHLIDYHSLLPITG